MANEIIVSCRDRKKEHLFVWALVVVCLCGMAHGARFSWSSYASKPDDWYRGEEGRRIADNILSWQDEHGSWPKNENTASAPFDGKPDKLPGTFDNGATTGEMRFLARAFRVTGQVRYQEAFLKALDLILKAQYPTGGWPQYYPPSRAYHRYITFNDNTMVQLMILLEEIATGPEYDFVDATRRTAAKQAFDRGVECILKCQIRVKDKLTVWCAQHDELDYSPRPGRSYELVSLSGSESADILKLLMGLDNPSRRVIDAITAGVEWYESAKVTGIRIQSVQGRRTAVQDPNAEPLWARFYEIDSNRPFFCDRDGVPKYDYNQIDRERSNGYSWYGDWGQDVIKAYQKWLKKWKPLLEPAGTGNPSDNHDSTQDKR